MDPTTSERILHDRQSRLTKLANTDEWQELKDEVERKQRRFLKRFMLSAISGQKIEQVQLDHVVSFMAGVRWVLAVPGQAEASLEKAIRRAETLKER